MNPLVSILIPSYNLGRFLPATLDSIQAQTCSDYEVLIADDGSSEPIRDVVTPYLDDKRFSFVQWQPNRGPHAALYYLYTRAKGDFWCPFSSDDLFHPDFLARRLEFMSAHPHASLIYGPTGYIDEEGSPVEYEYPYTLPTCMDSKTALRLLLQHNFVAGLGIMLRANMVKPVLGYFLPEWKYVQDWFMWMLVASTGFDFVFDPHPSVKYRIRRGSLGHQIKPTLLSSLEIRLLPLWAFSLMAQYSREAAVLWTRWKRPLYHLWLRRMFGPYFKRQMDPEWVRMGARCYYGDSVSSVKYLVELLKHSPSLLLTSLRERRSVRGQKCACGGLAQLDDPVYRRG